MKQRDRVLMTPNREKPDRAPMQMCFTSEFASFIDRLTLTNQFLHRLFRNAICICLAQPLLTFTPTA